MNRSVKTSGPSRGLAQVLSRPSFALILFSALSSFAPAKAADVLRCVTRLASEAATDAQVRASCGEPSYRSSWFTRTKQGVDQRPDTEVWYYDFGPSQLIRVVEFHDGLLASVDTDGYGFVSSEERRCTPGQIIEGISEYRLIASCGRPARSHSGLVLAQMLEQNKIFRGYYKEAPRSDYVTPTYREEFIYNFGSGYPERKATLLDGWVTDVTDRDPRFNAR